MATRIANTAASILNQTVLTGAQAQDITGLKSFLRSPSAPFAVQAGSAKVDNLDADLLDGQSGSYYNAAANLTGTALPAAIVTSSLTAVGTIATGVWNAGAVTSSGILTVNGFGDHLFTAGGAVANSVQVVNTTSGATSRAEFRATAGTAVGVLAIRSQGFTPSGLSLASGFELIGSGAGGLVLQASDAAGTIRIASGGSTQRALYDISGNYVLGATAANFTDAIATPTISSGFGAGPSIVGKTYAFVITIGTGGPVTGVVAFNITFANGPVVSVMATSTAYTLAVGILASQVTISSSAAMTAGDKLYVLVRGF